VGLAVWVVVQHQRYGGPRDGCGQGRDPGAAGVATGGVSGVSPVP